MTCTSSSTSAQRPRPPALQLQVSEDNGATWVSAGSPVTAVASGTVKAKATGEYPRHAHATPALS